MAGKQTGDPAVEQRDKWVVRVDGIDTVSGARKPRQLGTYRSRRSARAAASAYAAPGESRAERSTVGAVVVRWVAGKVDVSNTSRFNAAVLHGGWREQARILGSTPEAIVEAAVGKVRPRPSLSREEVESLIERAIEAISERQSTWRPTEIQRELAGLLSTDLGIDASTVVGRLDEVATWIATQRCGDISAPVPTGALLRRDGRPVSESAVNRALTTQAILDQEHDLLDWAERRLDADGDVESAAIDRSDIDLNIAQADAASRVAGDEQLVLIVGPAGTGKTTALRPAVAQLRADGRPVYSVLRHRRAAPRSSRRRAVSWLTRSTSSSSSIASTDHPTTATTFRPERR